jgi:tRNA threonylcarbamoyl adenosine modification protein YeaZ
MIALALHTTTLELGLALIEPDGTLRHQIWDLGRDLSSQLHNHLMAFLQPYTWQDLAWLAVCIGPGGFTGTRMGVVTARTLAQQLDISLFGVSSLAALAVEAPVPGGTAIAVTMPAKRGAVYGAVYQSVSEQRVEPILPDGVIAATDWQTKLAAWESPLHSLEVLAGEGLGTSVTGVIKIAQARWLQGQRPHWSMVLPFYGQHPVG